MLESADGFVNYVETLLDCESFVDAFGVFEQEVLSMGFEGALYTYIPKILLDVKVEPVYEVSETYAPGYLAHYSEARFDLYDPLIQAVENGESTHIDWWGPLCKSYIKSTPKSAEVLESSLDYGINNGVTLPLMSGARGLAGASFISSETDKFGLLMSEQLTNLQRCTSVFHNIVAANINFQGRFSKPLFESLSDTELRLLIELAKGQSMAQIANKINKSSKYMEQVMLSLRGKLSGNQEASRLINRNELLYYAGMLNILDHADLPALSFRLRSSR